MNTLDQLQFSQLLEQTNLKPRFKRELKFVSSVESLENNWLEYEFVSITDRTGNKGILLIQPAEALYIAQYELSRRIVDAQTGRERAVICDFCYTWQPGSGAASITFTHPVAKHNVTFLCCADLLCSQHVRTSTKAAVVSRARLRENMTNEDRISRLKQRLRDKIEQLELTEITLPETL